MANDLITALLIAIVQGVTEWVPVSSSGHLVIVEKLLNFNGGLFFDVALHFGTLMSVFVYFGKDITDILQDLLKMKFASEDGRMGLLLIAATIPAALVGFLFRDVFGFAFGDLRIVALGFGITGLFLFIASLEIGKERELGFWGAFLIGLSQVLSLFPGISRSGATISSGLLFGLKEEKAVKFSFLMSIPIIFGANILVIGNNKLSSELIWATLVSFLVGLLALHLLYRHVLNSKKNLRWFGIYALLLAFGIAVFLLV